MAETTCQCPLDTLEEERLRHSQAANELQLAGWEMQVSYTEPQLSEAAQLYRDMGFEVRLEAMLPPKREAEVCAECDRGHCTRYKTIFTRKP